MSENQKKDTPDGLLEIKRLAEGGAAGEKWPSKRGAEEKNPANNIANDLDAFKEEQKIFTQITSLKELGGEAEYELPASLNSNDKSAFEKLMRLSKESIKEDKERKTIISKESQSTVTQQETKTTENPAAKAVGVSTEPSITGGIAKEKNSNPFENEKNTGKKFRWAKPQQPAAEKPTQGQNNTAENNSAPQSKLKSPQENELKTPIDEIFGILEEKGQVDTELAIQITKLSEEKLDQIAKLFEEDGILTIEYPASLTKKPVLKMKQSPQSKLSNIPSGEVLEEYEITADNVPAKIKIIKVADEARPIYAIEMPAVGKYTHHFLNFIKDEVAENMPIEIEEIIDPKKSKRLKERFFLELSAHLLKYFPNSSEKIRNMLSGILLHQMYGLGDIELLMGDEMLEEVGINSAKTPITVYHRIHGWLKTNLLPGTEDDINNLSSQIGRKVGREITVLNPILDAHLLSGDRVNATLFPVSAEGNTLTIRRFARKPWTITSLIGEAHTMNTEMAATLWLAMQYELNVIIAGGTASGKTSTLNSLLALMPTYHRIISIEDVREIVLPKFLEWNWVPMVTRSPNPEGLGEVAMFDLMVTSLRMRPDRIIVGEMRRKKEAEVLMEAIETGHSIYSTIHANSGYQVLRRLAEPPMSIPLMQIELIDLIVVQYRDRRTNKRRTFEIAEIEQTSSGQGLQINTIYKWSPRTDNWEMLNKPNKLITLLNLHTGMTEEDISREISEKQGILDWMKRQRIIDLDAIGYILKLYYSDSKKVAKLAEANTPLKEILARMEKDKPVIAA